MDMHIDETQLKSFMLDSGLVSKKEIEDASKKAEESDTSIGRELVSSGVLSEDDLRRMQAYILGIPFVDLKNQHLDFSVLSLIPEPIARNQNIVAFKKTAEALEVAMLDTEDLAQEGPGGRFSDYVDVAGIQRAAGIPQMYYMLPPRKAPKGIRHRLFVINFRHDECQPQPPAPL